MRIFDFDLNDFEPEDGGHVADVVVLVRVVKPGADGTVGDYVHCLTTKHTTGLVSTGMHAAAYKRAMDAWEFAESDDEEEA